MAAWYSGIGSYAVKVKRVYIWKVSSLCSTLAIYKLNHVKFSLFFTYIANIARCKQKNKSLASRYSAADHNIDSDQIGTICQGTVNK